MGKIQNNFLSAIVNKDLDERLTPNGQMTDASNVMVISEDSGNVGVLKNIIGNLKVTESGITDAETIGSISDESKERCFYFVSGEEYDYVFEYNTITDDLEVVLQSSVGGVLNFNREYRISHSDIFTSVEGDDLLSWTDGFNPPRIINTVRAKTYGINGFTELEISVMKPSPIFAPDVIQEQISSDDLANFVKDKFLTFAYRYKYEDGYYSSFSSWSPYMFTPGNVDIDLITSTNISMQNNARAFNISFNTGPRSVLEVELVFKVSNSNNVYSIIKFNKLIESWGDNESRSFLFNNYKVYRVLSEEQFFRSFDNVPLTALTQARVGNRLIYGNFVEGRDIDTDIDFTVDYISSEINTYDVNKSEIRNIEYDENKSNVVDFWGESDEPIINLGEGISIDYETNIITLENISDTDDRRFQVNVKLQKEDTFSSVGCFCDVYVDGVLDHTFSFPSGVTESEQAITLFIPSFNKPPGFSCEVYLVVRSTSPLLYKLKAAFGILSSSPPYMSIKGFDTNDYYLTSKPNTIDSNTQEGNVVPLSVFDLDFSDFIFTSGSQYSFDFDIRLAYLFNTSLLDSYIFYYTLNSSFSDFESFVDDSNFLDSFGEFFNSIVNNTGNLIPSSSVISFVPANFQVDYVNKKIIVSMPVRQIEVEEPSGLTTEKEDYILCRYVRVAFSSSILFKSMHSSRDYEIGIVFLDDKGRKTTVFDSKNNNIYIPASNSATQNTITVDTIGNPPSWASYYKFAVKYNRGKYDVIYASNIYNDFIYSYIQLIGDNKNKVKEGDYLILKSDLRGPLDSFVKVKVLEVKLYEEDEIIEGSSSGFYFKIKNGNFDLELNDNDFLEFIGVRGKYLNPYYVYSKEIKYSNGDEIAFKPGNIVRFVSYCNRVGGDNQFRNSIDQKYYINSEYVDFREMFEDVIANSSAFLEYINGTDQILDYQFIGRNKIGFRPRTERDDKRYIRTKTDVYITTSEIAIFETSPLDVSDSPYIETPNVYTITDGNYEFTTHILSDLFNCYCFGNGAESISVRDELTTNFLNIDYGINAVSEDVYRQVNRYADLTYSGVYQESTNVNRLNEFNLSLANYKDDLEKSFGPIIVLDSEATDLLVIQEDRFSKVLYGKDLLYNADATTNLSRIEDVLGQQVVYGGEYGISSHPESYDSYATNSFNVDVKRGAVVRLNDSNGLMEISANGMRDYFKTLFRDNEILNIIGKYDAFFDIYILNIKYIEFNGKLPEYVTWVYSPEAQGFLGKQTFNPDDMLRVNNHFLSFKGADVYKHNVGEYNTFYDELYPSSFEFNFNQEPSTRKVFKNISIEGNSPWDITLKTDMQNGYINYNDFKNKEGVYYGYVRGDDALDTATLAVSGVGVVSSIVGNVLNFNGNISTLISVGDSIYDTNLDLLGVITDLSPNSITVNDTSLVAVDMFILSSKPSSVETSGIRGYYMNVKGELTPTDYVEVYALNSEVFKSFE
jgi:hypothetical protein